MSVNLSTLMVYVHDMPKAVTFYKGILDAAPQVESPEWSQFDIGAGLILGLHHARSHDTTPAPGWTPGFAVADLRAARELAIASGGTIAQEYHDIPGGVVLEIADPDGNVVDLSQMGITCADLGVKSA